MNGQMCNTIEPKKDWISKIKLITFDIQSILKKKKK